MAEEEVKKCTRCNKIMIKKSTDGKFPCRENDFWFWWCKCGNTEDGNYIRDKTFEDQYQQQWEEAQEKDLLE